MIYSPLRQRILLLFVISILIFSTLPARAERLSRDQVPEPLRPWVDWVLKDHEEELCTPLRGESSTRSCLWGSPLNLELNARGGSFSQRWRLEVPAWVPLPGDKDRWPQEVRVNGSPAAVLKQEDTPYLYLSAGEYSVEGSFAWNELPESFQIPPETPILYLSVGGVAKPVKRPCHRSCPVGLSP